MAKKKQTIAEKALEQSCGLFLASLTDVNDAGETVDTTPVEEFAKLKKAQKDGHGDDDAISHAAVWDKIGELSVDDVIDLVESNVKSCIKLSKKKTK